MPSLLRHLLRPNQTFLVAACITFVPNLKVKFVLRIFVVLRFDPNGIKLWVLGQSVNMINFKHLTEDRKMSTTTGEYCVIARLKIHMLMYRQTS